MPWYCVVCFVRVLCVFCVPGVACRLFVALLLCCFSGLFRLDCAVLCSFVLFMLARVLVWFGLVGSILFGIGLVRFGWISFSFIGALLFSLLSTALYKSVLVELTTANSFSVISFFFSFALSLLRIAPLLFLVLDFVFHFFPSCP